MRELEVELDDLGIVNMKIHLRKNYEEFWYEVQENLYFSA